MNVKNVRLGEGRGRGVGEGEGEGGHLLKGDTFMPKPRGS